MTNEIEVSRSFREFVEQTKEESKVSKFLYYYLRRQHRSVVRNITADDINYLTFRKDGTISYLPKGRELKFTDSGEWSRDGRQEGKPAKVITRIMKDALLKSLKARDLEIFSNLYKGRATDLYTIKEESGDGLKDIYRLSSPFDSCMKGEKHQDKLDLYADNPDSVGVLYVRAGNTCMARALIWTDEDGNKIVDRVYGSEEFRTMFREYAAEIGAYKKVNDSAGHTGAFYLPDGSEIVYKKFKIPLKYDADNYPYVDTFCYFDDDDMYLTNEELDSGKCLQCTDGSYENVNLVSCYGRSSRYPEEVCRWSNYHDMYVHEDDCVWIEEIDDYIHTDDVEVEDAIMISKGEYVLVSDCDEVECVDTDSGEGLQEIKNLSTISCYKTPDGDYIIEDDATIVKVYVVDGDIKGRS